MELRGKNILLVEDDQKIRQLIKIYLEKSGFEVIEAEDGEDGQRKFETFDPCFIIMDLMMPKQTGEELCRRIRTEWKSDVPIMMLTAKVDEQERINGLQLGADDYVTKPFSPQELVLRVETILRRTANRCSKISYRGLTVKPLRGEAKCNGTLLSLTNHEFRLLHFLMKHPGQILSREQILEELYPNSEKLVIERTIDVHVSKLREKLAETECAAECIETVRGMGYRFVIY